MAPPVCVWFILQGENRRGLTLRETGKANYLMHSEIPTAVNSMRNKYHSGGKDIIKIVQNELIRDNNYSIEFELCVY